MKMSRISKTYKAITAILKNPWLLNRVLSSPDLHRQYILTKYDRPDGFPVIDPADLFGDSHKTKLEIFSFLDGGSLVTDIALLKLLAGTIKNCKYFEIGTWRGESAANMVDNTEVCYTLNLSDAELREMKINEKNIELQGYFSGKNTKIVHIRANTRDFDFASTGKKFDLIFIDGDHHYDMVVNDTKKVFSHLTHRDSIVVWHDYAVNPEEIRYEVMAGILDGTPEEFHKRIYHVGHTKCAVYINRDIRSNQLDPPVKPEFYYQVDINYKKVIH
jgi:predicted O-methyltransferase YrrM